MPLLLVGDERVELALVVEFSLLVSEIASDRAAAPEAPAERLVQCFVSASLHLLIESFSRDLSPRLSFCRKREVSSGLPLFLPSPTISFTIDRMSPSLPLDLEESG